MQRILCVEDTTDTLMILEATLQDYELVFARTLKEARAILASSTFSLLILDVELPDGTALEILSDQPPGLKSTPVIFLTGRTDFATKVSAFALGADDYIIKPFDHKELRLRVDAKIRKQSSRSREQETLRIGDLTCHLEEQRIFLTGKSDPIDLTSLEFRIFILIAKTPNKIFNRTEILDRVWGSNVAVTERSVDVHVSNLRRKLEGSLVTIDAVIGSGYRILVKPVK